jgi:hypothetical protein
LFGMIELFRSKTRKSILFILKAILLFLIPGIALVCMFNTIVSFMPLLAMVLFDKLILTLSRIG